MNAQRSSLFVGAQLRLPCWHVFITRQVGARIRRALVLSTCTLLICCLASPGMGGGREVSKCMKLQYLDELICLERLLKTDPCNAEAFFELVYTTGRHSDINKLMAVLDELSASAPDKPHFFQMRARILSEHYKDDAAANAERKKAEGLQPCLESMEKELHEILPPTKENAENILERGMARYTHIQDYVGAAEDFETYLGLVDRPKGPYVYRQLAGARRQLGDLPGAIDALSLQIEVFPETAISALPTRARLCRELGDEECAKRDLAEVERLTLEHNQRTIARLNYRIASRPGSVSTYLERGRLKIMVGDFEGAIADANRAMELEPESAAAYELRAKAKIELGDLDGARADREYSFKLLRNARKQQEDQGN